MGYKGVADTYDDYDNSRALAGPVVAFVTLVENLSDGCVVLYCALLCWLKCPPLLRVRPRPLDHDSSHRRHHCLVGHLPSICLHAVHDTVRNHDDVLVCHLLQERVNVFFPSTAVRLAQSQRQAVAIAAAHFGGNPRDERVVTRRR